METFRFLNFKVYQDSKKFYNRIIELTEKVPEKLEYLVLQLRRSALSVILNIAEGSAKKSDRDFNRFIENSLGSINESLACLEIILEHGLITKETFHDLFLQGESIAKQLGGLSKKLKSS